MQESQKLRAENALARVFALPPARQEEFLDHLQLEDPAVYRIVVGWIDRDAAASQDGFLQRLRDVVPSVRNADSEATKIGTVHSGGASTYSRANTVPGSGPMPRRSLFSRFPASFGPNGRYIVHELVAEGGMGAVYKATDTSLNHTCALKIPHLVTDITPELMQRFLEEAKFAAAFTHRNICETLDVGECEYAGQLVPFLKVRWIEGRTLAEYMKRESQLSMEFVARIMLQITKAVAAAHAAGIVHRDLKPANVMLDEQEGLEEDERIKVMDFGLAARLGANEARITLDQMIIGTPNFMAPEGVPSLYGDGPDFSNEISVARDIYGVGGIMYELLCGRPPFQGTVVEVLQQCRSEKPIPPRTLCKSVNTTLQRICLKALEKQPAARYQTAGEMDLELQAAMQQLQRRQKLNTIIVRWGSVAAIIALAVIVIRMRNAKVTIETEGDATLTIETDKDSKEVISIDVKNRPGPAVNPPGISQKYSFELRPEWRSMPISIDRGIFCARYSPDEKKFVVGGTDSGVYIFDADDGTLRRHLSGHTAGVEQVCWAPDGGKIASSSRDGTVRIWDAATGDVVEVINCGCERAAVDWSPDGRWLVYAGKNYSVIFRDMLTGEESIRSAHQHEIYDISWSPNGRYCASSGNRGWVCLWIPEAVRPVVATNSPLNDVFCLAWSPDSASLACGQSGNKDTLDKCGILIMDVHKGVFRNIPASGPVNSVRSITWHPVHNIVVTGHMDRTIHFRSPETLLSGFETQLSGYINVLEFSRDGRQMLVTDDNPSIQKWNVLESNSSRPK